MTFERTAMAYSAASPPLCASLWYCDKCTSFVSIHSPQVPVEAPCPSCRDASMLCCGTFQNILGLESAADA